jgi:transposase
MEGDQQHATGPAGKTSMSWTPAIDHREPPVMKVKCSTKDGRCGDHVAPWRRSQQRDPRRTRTIRPQPPSQALQTARQRDATAAFQVAYARRAGIDGTLSRGIRRTRRRRPRDRGLPRVRRGHILTAAGLNGLRLSQGCLETARAQTRITPFARRMADGTAAEPDATSPAVSFLVRTMRM